MDYSKGLTDIAKRVVGSENIICDEAINLSPEPFFDLVSADSVFVYFSDLEYAYKVLDLMYKKAVKAVMLTEVYDLETKEECLAYRRSKMADYDEKYKGLDKLFYPKSFFEKFAKEKNMELEFTQVTNPFYWNSRYQYDVFMYKR